MDKIKLVALGGLDEDGKGLYVAEINDDIFVFVCGFKYPTKLTPGIDFLIADFTYLKERKDRIKAYIIPKTKKHTFGALPYIYQECPAPIYCTKLTADRIVEFSENYEVKSDFKFECISLPDKKNISGHEFTFFSTCASMPLSFGFSIKTSLGNIVYSGDFIVEYNNEQFYKLDLNTLGKIAEDPTLILLSESSNSGKSGYCSPNHRLYPFFKRCFEEANGRIFVALTDDNLYHIDEFCNVCNEYNKKVIFYDKNAKQIFEENRYANFLPKINICPMDDLLRNKDNEIVVLITADIDDFYEKVSLLANGENELRHVKINENDTFILAVSPSDENEVIATSTVDELYRAGCHVQYVKKKQLYKMHACEEDLRMLLSLLKPQYYFPIEGYYVDLLSNAKIAYDMKLNLSHKNIFLLDNGQTLTIDENGANLDFNFDGKNCKIGELMIDGVGFGDIVSEIINDRTRLGTDGVVVLACAVSKEERKIIVTPDVQMRGFLYLKDKESDALVKDITVMFTAGIEEWVKRTDDFDAFKFEEQIRETIEKSIKHQLNREPVVKPNVIVL